MIDIKDKTIAEIVSDDISTASVFKKYNLDFCCGGGKTVEKACEKANLNTEDVVNDLLNNTSQNSAPNLNFKDWKADFLVDYIVNVHHTYVKENLSIINEFATKVATVHGHHAPETIEIDNLFTALSNELINHLEKEETILFPAIKAKITDATFDEVVLKSDKPVVVDFWAAWCGPCRMVGPIIYEVSSEYDGKAVVGKFDVDANQELA